MLTRDQLALVAASQFSLFAHYANSVYWRAISTTSDAPMITTRTIARDISLGVFRFMNGLVPLMDDHVHTLAGGNERVLAALVPDISRAHAGLDRVFAGVSTQVQEAWRLHKLREGMRGAPSLGLRYHDAVGRSYAAEDSVRLLLRGFAVNAHVSERLLRLEEQGYGRVRLEYPDTSHERHGMVLDLGQSAVWREVYFHPNTNATVVGHD